MGPKKKKAEAGGGGEKAPAVKEIDKTFYEIQISDLNRKLARLRGTNEELESKYLSTQQAFEKMEADHADVIAYLKRSLLARMNDIEQLQTKIISMEQNRDTEIQVYKDKMKQVEVEYKVMHQELTSEIKLLNGKIGSLEEFRGQRDDLMQKYDSQEARIEEQEVRHKRILYESERKFVLGKDTLKKEMEARLLQLSTDFQEANEMRIAATTQRVIRENIAVNNELDLYVETLDTLENEREKMRHEMKLLRLSKEVTENERNMALSKTQTQTKLINRISQEHYLMVQKLRNLQEIEMRAIEARTDVIQANRVIDSLKMDIRMLEQHLHAARCECTDFETEVRNSNGEIERLKDIVYDTKMQALEALESKKLTIPNYISVLKALVALLTRTETEAPERVASLETVISIEATYKKGELDYLPLPKKKPHKYIRNAEERMTQVTPSLELMPPFIRTIPSEVNLALSESDRELSTEIPSFEEEEETQYVLEESSSSSSEDIQTIIIDERAAEEASESFSEYGEMVAEFQGDEYEEYEDEAFGAEEAFGTDAGVPPSTTDALATED